MQTRITLSSVKYAAFASEETHCFEATINFDGKPVCHVRNDGHGGADFHEPLKGQTRSGMAKALEPVEAFVRTLPPIAFEDGCSIDEDLETVVGGLMNRWLVERDLDRALKSKFLWVRADKPGLWEISRKKVPADYPERIRARHSGVEFTFLHEIPREQALKAFRGDPS